MTALVDHKFFGQLGDGTTMEIPEAVVGIVSGGVRNEENETRIRRDPEESQISHLPGQLRLLWRGAGPGQHVEK